MKTCLIPGAVFTTEVHDQVVSIKVVVPDRFVITRQIARILTKHMHNDLENLMMSMFIGKHKEIEERFYKRVKEELSK